MFTRMGKMLAKSSIRKTILVLRISATTLSLLALVAAANARAVDRLPTYVNVQVNHTAILFHISTADDQFENVDGRPAKDYTGQTIPEKKLILVRQWLKLPLKQQVLFHELEHACFWTSNQEGTLKRQATYSEDEAIYRVDSCIVEILRTQPSIRKFLQKR